MLHRLELSDLTLDELEMLVQVLKAFRAGKPFYWPQNNPPNITPNARTELRVE